MAPMVRSLPSHVKDSQHALQIFRDFNFLGEEKLIFTMDITGAYHLARKSGNFGLKSNGKVIFRKFRSKIVEYLQRYSSFSVWNGTAEISLPFA